MSELADSCKGLYRLAIRYNYMIQLRPLKLTYYQAKKEVVIEQLSNLLTFYGSDIPDEIMELAGKFQTSENHIDTVIDNPMINKYLP